MLLNRGGAEQPRLGSLTFEQRALSFELYWLDALSTSSDTSGAVLVSRHDRIDAVYKYEGLVHLVRSIEVDCLLYMAYRFRRSVVWREVM